MGDRHHVLDAAEDVLRPHLFVQPGIAAAVDDVHGHADRLPPAVARPTADGFHRAAEAAAADGEAGLRQPLAQLLRLSVVGIPFGRTRAAEHGDDAPVVHLPAGEAYPAAAGFACRLVAGLGTALAVKNVCPNLGEECAYERRP